MFVGVDERMLLFRPNIGPDEAEFVCVEVEAVKSLLKEIEEKLALAKIVVVRLTLTRRFTRVKCDYTVRASTLIRLWWRWRWWRSSF